MEVFTMVVLIVLIGCGTAVLNQHFKTRREELEHSSPNDDVYDEVEMLRERIEVLDHEHAPGELDTRDVAEPAQDYRLVLCRPGARDSGFLLYLDRVVAGGNAAGGADQSGQKKGTHAPAV